MCTSYGLNNEILRNEKLQKYTNYLQKWLVHFFDRFTAAMFISFARYLNTGKPRPTFYLTELTGDGKRKFARFHAIKNFLANKIYHFSSFFHQTGCPFTWTACSIWSVPWNFKSFFLTMQFYSHVLVICQSSYLYLKLSHEILTFISFNIWR